MWIKWYAHGIGTVIREVRMPLLLLVVAVMVVVVVILFVTRLVIIIIVVYVRVATVGRQLHRLTLSQVSNHFLFFHFDLHLFLEKKKEENFSL